MFPALVTPSIQIPLSLNKWMVWLGKRSCTSCGGKKLIFPLLSHCTNTCDKCYEGEVQDIKKKYNEDGWLGGNQGMLLKKWFLSSDLRDKKRLGKERGRDLRKREQHVQRPLGLWIRIWKEARSVAQDGKWDTCPYFAFSWNYTKMGIEGEPSMTVAHQMWKSGQGKYLSKHWHVLNWEYGENVYSPKVGVGLT